MPDFLSMWYICHMHFLVEVLLAFQHWDSIAYSFAAEQKTNTEQGGDPAVESSLGFKAT